MGKNLIITRNGNRVPMENRRTATRVTAARQNWALNAEDTVTITVESPFPQKYEIGDIINIFGRDYKLNRLPKIQKTGAQEFKYDLEFEGVQYDLFRVIYDLTIDTTNNELQDVSGESLTGDIGRFLTVLISNANRVFPGKWKLGEYPKDTKGDTTITFSEGDNCLSVLQTICQKFEKEFEIETGADGVHVINVKKIGKTLPYRFKHGKGRGLYSLRRENVSSSNIVTRLKVYGSTENITMKYRANRLCLPGKSKGQSYIEDAKVVAKYGIWEGRKVFDEIKPSFTGKVTGVVSGNILSFIDDTFPFDLNDKEADGKTTKYLLPDSPARIHFNTGNLAGFEFEVTKYDHAKHSFTIKKQIDKRGDIFPSETSSAFQFALGDEYKILNIAYSPDIEQRAEMDLQETGTKYYKQNCQPKVQYTCTITEKYLEGLADAPQGAIVNIFAPGDYVYIIDEDIDVDKSIRIKSFQRDILHPYDYQLTISDIPVTISVVNRVISELIDIDKIIEINDLKDATKARANWRSSREVLNMVFDPEGDYYTDKIKPNSIDTLALSVGAKSMQFGLINTIFKPNHKGNPRNIVWKGGVLTHYTINPEHAVSWILGDGSLMFSQTDDKTAFYIYAKCPKDGSTGTIVFTTQQHKVDGDALNYYFWIGVLNSTDDESNARALSLTYGFTMINGRFIKTGRVESADGTTYFDLDKSEIGGRIVFNSNGQNKTLEQLGKEALESKDFINNTLPGILSEIQSQLDGQIEQFFEKYDPTLTNAPAKDWTTQQMKESHLGDLFYNTETGKVYRFVKNGSVYSWQVLQDSELAQALALANDALALAKTKRRIFTDTPYTPYEVGDLWVQGSGGDIMRCKTTRASGAYTLSDWEKASKYTDNTELNAFISGTYNDAITEITKQIDGKIETWFQTSDPASAWVTNDVKAKHVGDMWYNSSEKKLKRYSSSFGWVEIVDKTAIDAYEAAQSAKDTADGKRRVFVSTPYPPYDIGDLWVDGKELRRCITGKKSGSYSTNDWVIAVYYDNTKTIIDGGIVTSGTIQVAGDNKSILAGITGQGTEATSIRFWAGASFENRANAPFRVMQDGTVVMSKANITGTVNANDGYIGGFRIQPGQIGYGTSSEQDSTEGLALLSQFIRFRNKEQFVLLGCCSSLGYPFNGLMEMETNNGVVLRLNHKATNDSWYNPKALEVIGNQFNLGKFANFDTGYIGQAYTDVLETYIHNTHSFVFNNIASSYLNVRLPNIETLRKKIGANGSVAFLLYIQITWLGNNNKIRLSGVKDGYLVDCNANRPNGGNGYWDMAQGDSIILRACGNDYYIIAYGR